MIRKTTLFIAIALILISIDSIAQNVRGFYLQDVGDWLGDATKENNILSYAQGNGFNYILFYDLGDINWNSTTEKNQLAAFMRKAKTTYGITQIGGVVEYSGYLSQKIIPYNNSRTSSKEKFDVINLEFEFWVTSSITSSYCSKFLRNEGFTCDKAGAWQFAWREFKLIDDICAANGLISEFYLGWPDVDQMQKIASRADRILLSAYRPTDSDIYQYSTNRMKDIASIGGTTKVITLLSSESSFMGPWLATHQQTRPYQTMKNALAAETLSFKNNISLQGYQWFTYRYMPKTMLATASITASGPTTFCPGNDVTLTANSGSSYLWSPGGQTTRSITVSSAGSYTVRVTNSSGVSIVSSAVTVSTSANGQVPSISSSGPTSFCPGGYVTLTSSNADSYLWSNGETTRSITANATGSYTVTTEKDGCSETSNPKSVDADAGPTVPTVTANGSLDVCPGAVLVLTSSSANEYEWSNGATTRSIVVTSPGNYFVSTSSGPGCSAQSTVKTVSYLSGPAIPTITLSGPTTLDSVNTSIELTASSGDSYEWITGSSSQSITVTSQGNYRVTVIDANGCTATSEDVIVSANGCTPPPVPVITASGASVISNGQSLTLTANGIDGYLWSNGDNTSSIEVTSSGTYTVREYEGGGCYSVSLPFTVTVVNGSLDISEIIAGTNDHFNKITDDRFSVYPNPAKDQLNISFDQIKKSDINIKLVDVVGHEVQNIILSPLAGNNVVEVSVSELSHGIYFAHLIIDGEKHVKKFIVE
jgi:hypothetical protein